MEIESPNLKLEYHKLKLVEKNSINTHPRIQLIIKEEQNNQNFLEGFESSKHRKVQRSINDRNFGKVKSSDLYLMSKSESQIDCSPSVKVIGGVTLDKHNALKLS